MISIDLRKAFVTIDDKMLIEKMKFISFSNIIKWYECYLSERLLRVYVDSSFSDKALIICGAILGPLLFLLYVNAMAQAVNCDLLLYADDIGFIFQHSTLI